MSKMTIYNLGLIIVLIAVMYFVMIRPQRQQDKKNKEMRAALKIGDEIVTIGGIVGKITKITEKTVTIQTGNPNTKMEIIKGAISTVSKKSDAAAEKKDDMAEKTEDAEEKAPNREKKVTPKKLGGKKEEDK